MGKRVVVGMSGGVDSAVAALLMKKAGHEVSGVTMMIYSGGPATSRTGPDSCYCPGEEEDARDAARVCAWLGIPHRTVDLKAEYRANVLQYARGEYMAGRTPNPCVRCNQVIKFGFLLEKLSREAGPEWDWFATGHYCAVSWSADRHRFILRKAVDSDKDQSYFLCMLSQGQLGKTLFPLGALTKAEVRRIAREAGLPNHDRPESQDFAAGGYQAALGAKAAEGPITDAEGRVIGTHGGIWRYTIGQRRGLGIGGGDPLYVTRIDARTNTVVVGPEADLYKRELVVDHVNWVSREPPSGPIRAGVKIRYRNPEAPALVAPDGNGVRVFFDEPQKAIARGQWAVFYDGDELLGGGVITG